jgi:hypothetical protein
MGGEQGAFVCGWLRRSRQSNTVGGGRRIVRDRKLPIKLSADVFHDVDLRRPSRR